MIPLFSRSASVSNGKSACCGGCEPNKGVAVIDSRSQGDSQSFGSAAISPHGSSANLTHGAIGWTVEVSSVHG